MPQRRAVSDDGSTSELSITRGATYGAAAFVAAFVLNYALLILDDREGFDEIRDELSEIGMSVTDIAAAFFFNSHFVDWELSSEGQSESINLLEEGDPATVPEFAFYAVPVVALFAAGYLLYDRRGAVSAEAAFKMGATTIAGYLPLVFLATVLFSGTAEVSTLSGSGSMSYGFDTPTALVLAGVLYPAVFGGIGGYVAHSRAADDRVDRRRDGSDRRRADPARAAPPDDEGRARTDARGGTRDRRRENPGTEARGDGHANRRVDDRRPAELAGRGSEGRENRSERAGDRR